MILDVLIPILLVLVSVLISWVGVEMANNPPTTNPEKAMYRTRFKVLGLALVILTFWQALRASAQQSEAQRESREVAVTNARNTGALQSQLTTLQNLMADAMATFRMTTDPKLRQLADSYAQLAQSVGKSAQPPATDATPAPPSAPRTAATNLELKSNATSLFTQVRSAYQLYIEAEARLDAKSKGQMLVAKDADERVKMLSQYGNQKAILTKQEISAFNRLNEQATRLLPRLMAQLPKETKAPELPMVFVDLSSIESIGNTIVQLADKIPDR
jgi:hypothetical protein